MKMIMVICPEDRKDDVQQLISKQNVHGYSAISNVIGEGVTGKHMGTHTWPGKSALFFTIVEDAKQKEILEALQTFQAGLYKGEGLRAFVMPVEESSL